MLQSQPSKKKKNVSIIWSCCIFYWVLCILIPYLSCISNVCTFIYRNVRACNHFVEYSTDSEEFCSLLACCAIGIIVYWPNVTPSLNQHWANVVTYVGPLLYQYQKMTYLVLCQRWPNMWDQRWADEHNCIGPTSFTNVGPV